MKRKTIIIIAGAIIATGFLVMNRDQSLGVTALTTAVRSSVQKGAQASGAAYGAISSSLQEGSGSIGLPSLRPAETGESAQVTAARLNEYARQYLAILVQRAQDIAAAIDRLLEEEKQKALESAKKPLVDAYVSVTQKVGSSIGVPVAVSTPSLAPSPSPSVEPSPQEPVPSRADAAPFAYRIGTHQPIFFSFDPVRAGAVHGVFDVKVVWGDGTILVRRGETRISGLVFSHTWEREGRYEVSCTITRDDGTTMTYEAIVDIAP